MKIDWAIKANGKDVTENFRPYLISINVTDATASSSDSASIVLNNSLTSPLSAPVQGDELEIFLGYTGNIKSVGNFVVDKATFAGPPDTMTITCRPSQFVLTALKQTEESFADKKTRSWEPSNVLAIAVKIAAEHGVEFVSSEKTILSGLATPHLDQQAESDLLFLSSRLDNYGWFVKVGLNKLIIQQKSYGLGRNAITGEAIPKVTIKRSEVSTYSGEWSDVAVFDRAIASWYDATVGQTKYESAGTGNRVYQFTSQAPTQDAAKQWAKNIITRSAGNGGRMSMSMPGRTDLQCEQVVTFEGFPYPLSETPTKLAIAKQWVIKQVDLSMSSAGFTTSINGQPYVPPVESLQTT